MIMEQKLSSTNHIVGPIKDMFADILEDVLQSEIEEQLGY